MENTLLYGMKFDGSRALLERGIALGYAGQTGEAMKAYAQVVDPKSLEIVPAFQGIVTEGRQLETILYMAEASLTGKARDMGEAIRYWQAALDRAREVSSKHTERKIRAVYREMLRFFPDEEQIESLGEQMETRRP